MNKKFYLTTTLPYVNAPLHMGHALEFIRADAIARYKKLVGYEVYFNTGTDEHGQKIYQKAIENNLSPQEFVDNNFKTFIEQVKIFGIVPDINFIRTTDEKHIKIASDFWCRVFDNGFIYKKKYHTKYCIGCESNKTDSELDEQGFCREHVGIELETIDEENYFFKYSLFGERLLEMYENNHHFIIPDFRLNEMKEFIKRGLEDFSISRLKSKMSWGIPVPNDSDHVMYVWFDALTNYISTLATNEMTLDELLASQKFQDYWVNGYPTQYCGKDNTRFQGIMWQAMLMAANIPNSKQVVVNGFITGEGGIRMSKTLGNVVDPRDIVSEYSTDSLRYFLLSEISNFDDSPFTIERFKNFYNSKLANGIGNLTSRILTLSEKHLDKTPNLLEKNIPQEFFNHLENFDIMSACNLIDTHISMLDKEITDTQPFKIIKTDVELGKKNITDLVISLNIIAEMLSIMMPETSTKILYFIRENKKPDQALFLRKE